VFIWPSHATHQSSAPKFLKPSSSPYSQSCSCLERVHPVGILLGAAKWDPSPNPRYF
jgi:hypothetical protein